MVRTVVGEALPSAALELLRGYEPTAGVGGHARRRIRAADGRGSGQRDERPAGKQRRYQSRTRPEPGHHSEYAPARAPVGGSPGSGRIAPHAAETVVSRGER